MSVDRKTRFCQDVSSSNVTVDSTQSPVKISAGYRVDIDKRKLIGRGKWPRGANYRRGRAKLETGTSQCQDLLENCQQ